jgi:ParB family chromosome partitioning protein
MTLPQTKDRTENRTENRTRPIPAPPETKPAGDAAILDLDPALVDPSFIADRMEPVDETYRALLASIADRGQIAPILVRPHPDMPGRYQVACGHRRLRAAEELGCAVRAILRPLTDRDLVIAQGQENSARADLSFIERARFAQALDQRRYGRDLIAQALSTDKPSVSRFLAVCNRLPGDVVEAVRPAPAAGRERWLRLANAFRRRAGARPIDGLLDSAGFITAPSDLRFAMLYRHLTGATPLPHSGHERRRYDIRLGLSYATATVTDRAFLLRLDRSHGRDFGAFLVSRLDGLFDEYAATRAPARGTGAPRIRHSLGR